MASCCDNNCAVEALHKKQRSTLIKVLWINAVMFIVIVVILFYFLSCAWSASERGYSTSQLSHAVGLLKRQGARRMVRGRGKYVNGNYLEQ